MDDNVRSGFHQTNGITLHAMEAGPDDGRLVVLLHGFPEFWYGWRHQIGPLAEAGFRVVAPDQRGYNLSDKPPAVSAYALEALAADVIGLIETLGRRDAVLVGHDWGGIVAWWAAMQHPDRVARLVILNAPHPLVMRRRLKISVRQLIKSWYVFAFQLPRIPEILLRRRDWRGLADALQTTSRPGTFADSNLDRYRAAWSQPDAIRSMIHWYRAGLRFPARPANARVRCPTLILWGADDRFLHRSLVDECLAYCDQGEGVLFPGVSHWVQHEAADEVNRRLRPFASAN